MMTRGNYQNINMNYPNYSYNKYVQNAFAHTFMGGGYLSSKQNMNFGNQSTPKRNKNMQTYGG